VNGGQENLFRRYHDLLRHFFGFYSAGYPLLAVQLMARRYQ